MGYLDAQPLKSYSNEYPGWHVGNDSSITASTVCRWIASAVEAQCHDYSWQEAESYTLFPVEVQPNDVRLTYSVHKNGAALSRESQERVVPGDYGLYAIGTNYTSRTTVSWLTQCIGDSRLYYFFQPAHSFSDMEGIVKANSAALSAKVPHFCVEYALLSNAEQASLIPSIIRQALNRDRRCLFSGAVPSCDSDTLVATWIFQF